MRRFRVWLDKGVPGCSPKDCFVELPDDASDDECDAACADALETLIANELDTGWEEMH